MKELKKYLILTKTNSKDEAIEYEFVCCKEDKRTKFYKRFAKYETTLTMLDLELMNGVRFKFVADFGGNTKEMYFLNEGQASARARKEIDKAYVKGESER